MSPLAGGMLPPWPVKSPSPRPVEDRQCLQSVEGGDGRQLHQRYVPVAPAARCLARKRRRD